MGFVCSVMGSGVLFFNGRGASGGLMLVLKRPPWYPPTLSSEQPAPGPGLLMLQPPCSGRCWPMQ